MAPQKVLQGFHRNCSLLCAVSNLTFHWRDDRPFPPGALGVALGSVPGLQGGEGRKCTKVGIPSERQSPRHLA